MMQEDIMQLWGTNYKAKVMKWLMFTKTVP